jgi:hypothetical protein
MQVTVSSAVHPALLSLKLRGGVMDWKQLMQDMELPLLGIVGFPVGFTALYGLALLAAKPVGMLIGHTLMLFPAYRRWRKEKAMFDWWEEKLKTGLHFEIYSRLPNGERRYGRSFDLGGPASDSVNSPEKPVKDNENELDTLTPRSE